MSAKRNQAGSMSRNWVRVSFLDADCSRNRLCASRALGECNAIKSRGFEHRESTSVGTFETGFNTSSLQRDTRGLRAARRFPKPKSRGPRSEKSPSSPGEIDPQKPLGLIVNLEHSEPGRPVRSGAITAEKSEQESRKLSEILAPDNSFHRRKFRSRDCLLGKQSRASATEAIRERRSDRFQPQNRQGFAFQFLWNPTGWRRLRG
jgi:hypothetical protein